ncbi:MAG: segregation and condensation protein A [Gammaproteobacteria bacterium]|nr:segregation and condensation protein A [Gammaproteobacteria bacterium]
MIAQTTAAQRDVPGAHKCGKLGAIFHPSTYVVVKMSEHELSKEEQVLAVMKRVITDIAKETFAKPGHVHPLTEGTIRNMRDCLGLIAARESELQSEAGRSSTARPQFIDEPNRAVVVPITDIKKRGE